MGDFNLKRSFMGGLLPNARQTDVAHMVDFAHTGLILNGIRSDSHEKIHQDRRIEDVPQCAGYGDEYEDECKAQHYFGTWFDSMAKPRQSVFDPQSAAGTEFLSEEMSRPYPESGIESLMICPGPNFASTGAHRIVAVFMMSGERYAAVFEEGGSFFKTTKENVFIDGLTPAADENVRDFRFIEDKLIPSIVYAMTGHELYRPAHKFVIDVFDPATPPEDPSHTGHWFEGCRPSKKMYHY